METPLKVSIRDIGWTLTPQKNFDVLDIRFAMGMIPVYLSGKSPYPLKEQLINNSGGGNLPTLSGLVNIDGHYQHENDLALPPLATAASHDHHIFIYPYGIIAIIERNGHNDKDKQFITALEWRVTAEGYYKHSDNPPLYFTDVSELGGQYSFTYPYGIKISVPVGRVPKLKTAKLVNVEEMTQR